MVGGGRMVWRGRGCNNTTRPDLPDASFLLFFHSQERKNKREYKFVLFMDIKLLPSTCVTAFFFLFCLLFIGHKRLGLECLYTKLKLNKFSTTFVLCIVFISSAVLEICVSEK